MSAQQIQSYYSEGLSNSSNVRYVDKFGENPAVGATFEDIWQEGGTLSWLSSAETMDVVSTTANDDKDSGTGARQIIIEGLDNNFLEVSETVQMEGLTPVTTTQTFLRVNRAYCDTVGSNGVNDGKITITASTAATVQATIAVGLGQTLKSQYTVPANNTAFITDYVFSVGKADDAQVQLEWRESSSKSWRVLAEFKLFESSVERKLSSYKRIPEKSDIRMLAKRIVAGSDIAVSGSYDFVLVNPL